MPTRLHALAASAPGRYGVAILSTVVAFLFQKLLGRFIHPTPFVLLSIAVMLSGWWGGGGPGLLAIALSALLADYFFLAPFHSFKLEPGHTISLSLFILLGTAMTWLNVSLRRTSAERAQGLERERQARLELETERTRLRGLLMQAPAYVALFQGPQHVYVLSNPLNNEALNHRPVLGRPVREAVPEMEGQGFVAELDRVYATGTAFTAQEMPVKLPGPHGTQRELFISLIYQATRDAQGRIDGIAHFGFDVTLSVRARQQAEALAAELQQSEERYRAFVTKSTEGIYRVATTPIDTSLPEDEKLERIFRDAYIAECNDAMARMYGFERASEVQGLPLTKLLVREDPHNTEFLRAFLQSGYRLEDAESHEVAKDGSPRTFLNNLVGTVEGGFLLGAWGTQRDVTRQRHAEQELKRAESHARLLAEASGVLASSLDYESTLRNVARLAVPALADWCVVDLLQPDGKLKRVETVSAAPEDAELVRQVHEYGNTSELNPGSPAFQSVRQGRSFLFESVPGSLVQQSTQSPAHGQLISALGAVSYITVPMMARGRALGVLSFFTSRSGRRFTQVELALLEELAGRAALSVENARLYREAQDAIRLRDEFLSIASHELKTPLTPLSLKLHMLSREARRQPESPFRKTVEDYITVGNRQVKRLAELVGDLLDVSRIAGGRFSLELEQVEMAALMREIVARHEPEATRAGSALVLEAPQALAGQWDRLRLEQVITNLVDNAIKYGAGKPIHLQLEADGDRALLRVKDEGIGIAPENLTRIFGRFERAVSERHYGGLGLGLYITRTIVEAMRGSIQVESMPGQGATFTVVLPRKQEEAPPAQPRSEASKAQGPQGSSVEPPGGAPAFRET